MRCCSNSTQAGTTNWLHIDLLFCWLHPKVGWGPFEIDTAIRLYIHIYIYTYIYIYVYIYICMWIYQGQLISASPTVPSSRPRPFVKAARPAVAGDLGLRQGQAAKLSCRQEKTPDFSHIFGWSHFESLSSFDPYHTLTPFLHPFANRFSSDHPKCDWEVSGTSPIWPSRLLINFYK